MIFGGSPCPDRHGRHRPRRRGRRLAYLSFYGLLTYGSYALYNSTLSKLPTTLVAISGYGQPIIASSLAALFLNEIPSWTSFLGALIIVSGLILATKA